MSNASQKNQNSDRSQKNQQGQKDQQTDQYSSKGQERTPSNPTNKQTADSTLRQEASVSNVSGSKDKGNNMTPNEKYSENAGD